MQSIQQSPILAASICARKGDDVLLIRRGQEPNRGRWAFPGGKVMWGETIQDAALRELREEANVSAVIGGLIDIYEIISPTHHYVIHCFFAHSPKGKIIAGDDADDVKWISKNSITLFQLSAHIFDAVEASEKFMRF